MPDLGGSAYVVLETVFILVRSLVNDRAGSWATDAVLLPYANAAYRTVNAELGNIQAASYIKDNVLFTLPAVKAQDSTVETLLNDAGYNNGTQNFIQYGGGILRLPPDLLVPLALWERTPATSDDFVEMTDMTDTGGLPSQPQGTRLRHWEWRTEGIFFLGATQDEEIRLRYEAAYLDMSDGTSPVPIRQGANAIAYKTSELASVARGGAAIPMIKPLYDDEMELLKNRMTQREQHVGRRRRAYSSRSRGRWM